MLKCAHVRICWLMGSKVLSHHQQRRNVQHIWHDYFRATRVATGVYRHAGFDFYTTLCYSMLPGGITRKNSSTCLHYDLVVESSHHHPTHAEAIHVTEHISQKSHKCLQAVQDAADRLVRLEQGLVDANSYAETEAVRSAQTEAVLDGLLHFKTHTEAKLVAAQASLDHLLWPHKLPAHAHVHQQLITSTQEENSSQLQMVIPKQQQSSAFPVANKHLQQIAMPQQQQEGVTVLRDQTNQQQLAQPQQIVGQMEAVPEAAEAGPPQSLWQSQLTHELQSQKVANAALWQQVQSQQAVISSMQAQLAAVLQRHGTNMDMDRSHDEMASATTGADTVQGASADVHKAATCGTEHTRQSEDSVDVARGNDAVETVTGNDSPSSASDEETRAAKQASDSQRLTCADDDSSATVNHRQAASNEIPFRFFRTINAPHRFL